MRTPRLKPHRTGRASRSARQPLEARLQRVAKRTAERERIHQQLQAETAERAALQEQVLLAAERERARIGRDLHDGLCQLLTGICCKTEVLMERLQKHAPAEARKAHDVSTLLVPWTRRVAWRAGCNRWMTCPRG